MNQKELQRFLKTMDSLAPRRKVYKRDDDDTDYVITLITEAIKLGHNRTNDIFNYVKEYRGIAQKNLVEILKDKLDELWIMSKGEKTTRHYHLIGDDDV